MSLCVCMPLSLSGFVGVWDWPSGTGHLALGRGSPCHPHTQIPTSQSPQGLAFAEEGSSLFPNTPTMHCKIPGKGDLGCWGAGQSLVGLLLSDRTGRQGLDTSRQGRGGEERRRRKKKEVGSRKGGCAMVVTVTRALQFWGPWEGCRGEKRQLKPVEVGPVPHPHPGSRGQLYSLLWPRASRPWGRRPGSPLCPGVPCGRGSVSAVAVPGVLLSPLILTRPARSLPSFPGHL